jgi:hypothetical protein
MCCFLEIGMTIFGIVTLTKGRFMVSKSKVVTGSSAHIIGALLTATFPLALGIGFVVGFLYAVNTGQAPGFNPLFVAVDAGVVGLILLAVLVIAFSAGKPETPAALPDMARTDWIPPPPADPNNPYSAPQAPPPRA